MQKLNKVFYSFVDAGTQAEKNFKEAGFKVELLNKQTGICSAELDVTDSNMLNISKVLNNCKHLGLKAIMVQIGTALLNAEEDSDMIEWMVSLQPLRV
jgi:hypothetical protein